MEAHGAGGATFLAGDGAQVGVGNQGSSFFRDGHQSRSGAQCLGYSLFSGWWEGDVWCGQSCEKCCPVRHGEHEMPPNLVNDFRGSNQLGWGDQGAPVPQVKAGSGKHLNVVVFPELPDLVYSVPAGFRDAVIGPCPGPDLILQHTNRVDPRGDDKSTGGDEFCCSVVE